ncbi:MAG: hypothetical protein RL031_951 [Actinomycetota bacterium]|jgi:hypothetical protein
MGELAAVLRPSLGTDPQKAPDIRANCADSQANCTLTCEINYWNWNGASEFPLR